MKHNTFHTAMVDMDAAVTGWKYVYTDIISSFRQGSHTNNRILLPHEVLITVASYLLLVYSTNAV